MWFMKPMLIAYSTINTLIIENSTIKGKYEIVNSKIVNLTSKDSTIEYSKIMNSRVKIHKIRHSNINDSTIKH